MENVERILQDMILATSDKPKKVYQCPTCKDIGWIETENGCRHCSCFNRKLAEERMNRNGLEPGKMNMKNFDKRTQTARQMRQLADDFLKNYPDGSMAVLGQVGSGKTHIMVATAQELINRGIDVSYRSYVDMMATLRQNRFDEEGYGKLMKELKRCEVLVIDDLFKGINQKTSGNDLSIIFEIINNRYLNHKCILISSEINLNEMVNLDEAIGTRIAQMCSKYILQVAKDTKKNRRMNE